MNYKSNSPKHIVCWCKEERNVRRVLGNATKTDKGNPSQREDKEIICVKNKYISLLRIVNFRFFSLVHMTITWTSKDYHQELVG